MPYTPTDYSLVDGVDDEGTPAPTVTVAKLTKGEAGIAAAQAAADTALGAEPVNVVAASGAAVTLPGPLVQPNSHITQTANCTFTLPAAVAGTTMLVAIKHNATGGWTRSWAVAGGDTLIWVNGNVEPTVTPTANKTDLYVFTALIAGTWIGADAGRNA